MSELSLKSRLERTWGSDNKLHFYDFSGLNQSLSFAEFGDRSREVASSLERLGVGPGVVVALMGPTDLQLTSACTAVWSLGATLTVLPIPTRLQNLELFLTETLGKLQESRASLLLGDEGVVSAFSGMAPCPVLAFGELEKSDLRVSGSPFGAENPALIQFSSGTTRKPKPILLSERALLANSQAVLECFPGGAENHSCVSWLPLYHDMGLIGCFLMPLLAPGDLTLMGPEVFAVRPLTWLEAISKQRATTSSAPNFALAHCVQRVTDEELSTLDLSCWQIAMVGAETVRPKTLRSFAERFSAAGFSARAFSPVYGLAEATLAVTFSPLGGGLRTTSFDVEQLAESGRVVSGDYESANLGQPLRGVEVEIRDGDTVLPEGQLGDLWVKSEGLYLGTLVDGQLQERKGDWLQTGDAAFLLQGELFLYGRRKDILLLDGRNHDPSMVEQAAEELSELRRCCAFTAEKPEEEKDSLVLLCEVGQSFQGEAETLVDSVRRRCREDGAPRPQEVLLLKSGSLPVTSSGKLRRAAAAAEYSRGELSVW